MMVAIVLDFLAKVVVSNGFLKGLEFRVPRQVLMSIPVDILVMKTVGRRKWIIDGVEGLEEVVEVVVMEVGVIWVGLNI